MSLKKRPLGPIRKKNKASFWTGGMGTTTSIPGGERFDLPSLSKKDFRKGKEIWRASTPFPKEELNNTKRWVKREMKLEGKIREKGVSRKSLFESCGTNASNSGIVGVHVVHQKSQ